MTTPEAKISTIKSMLAIPMLMDDVDKLIERVNEISDMLQMNANAFGVIFFGHLLETMIVTANEAGCHLDLDGFLEATKQSIIHRLNKASE